MTNDANPVVVRLFSDSETSQDLRCGSNLITAIDLTKNPALTSVRCNSNLLTDLDVTKNKALTYLYCNSNRLTTSSVDQIINDCANFLLELRVLIIRGNSAPSSASATALQTLINRGCAVITD